MNDVLTYDTRFTSIPMHRSTPKHVRNSYFFKRCDISYVTKAVAGVMVTFTMVAPSFAHSNENLTAQHKAHTAHTPFNNSDNQPAVNKAHVNQTKSATLKPNNATANKQPALNLGVNVIYSDKGFTNYSSKTMIVPSISYTGNNTYVRGNQLGYKSDKNSLGQASIYAQYGGAGYDAKEAYGKLQGLENRDSSIMVGVGYEKMTKFGGFSGQINKDVMNKSDGMTAKLAYSAFAKKGKLILFPSIGVTWQDQKYNDYYYGVTASESQKTGIASYRPTDSISPYINVMGNYIINQKLSIFLNNNISYYADEQKNSPKIAEKTAVSSIIGLSYQY